MFLAPVVEIYTCPELQGNEGVILEADGQALLQ